MAEKTEMQEKASLIAFYYAIEKGANLGTLEKPAINASDRDENLYTALKGVYPQMDTRWYTAFIKQSIVLLKHIHHQPGTTDTTYNYGRFGHKGGVIGKTDTGIPANKVSTFGDWIWNSFSKEQKKLFGSNPKKDSWNPMDVYLIKVGNEKEFIKEISGSCCFGDDRLAPDVEVSAKLEVRSLNGYLAYYMQNTGPHKNTFVGISLKETDFGNPKVTENNIIKGFEHIHPSCGMITKPMTMSMTVVSSKKNKKGIVKEGLNFKTNSLKFEADFNIGQDRKMYTYESKISSVKHHATEPRDRVKGSSGGFTNAAARNGAVPTPKMEQIVKEFSGQNINQNIPLNSNFDNQDKREWIRLLTDIKRSGTTPTNTQPQLGDFEVLLDRATNKWWTNMSATDWVNKVVELDDEFTKKNEVYPKALRSKLRAARYIYMFQQAEREHRLGRLIAEIYFASAKINISKDDLSGPFIKIQ